ncbi:DUF3106 domain-containing protein [Aquabacterium sp. OR-4]|uniref:DUF3106 domain-containing protein n=1 Tax=Aquabacterium sp. OR-4 TaxID=2978127 RepID=UPI0021B41341|nr:DUF3106 domain-containing protein [Aquabacterium sp. OR-4]MDT7835256.1 DUF3106 domain-containing protein [Aquabacterium sp. OR-4]
MCAGLMGLAALQVQAQAPAPVAPAAPVTSIAPATQPAATARPGTAAPVAEGPSWASLSAQQRAALAPLARDWAGIGPAHKAKWLEVAARFPKIPADEQQRVQARMADWTRLSPAERTQARLSFQETKQIPREEKQARWEAYQALPPEQRKALADRSSPAATERARPVPAAAQALDVAQPKQNLVPPRAPASAPLVKPVAPTVVQAKPGATTTLMTKTPTPPAHQQPGQPKIAARASQVDRSTLLPKTGPQAAASVPGSTGQP